MKRGRNQRRRQGPNVNRALDSSGPDVKIRGTAAQIYEKYQALSRDAASAGDRVKGENYAQHAEHYFRVMRAMQPNFSAQTQSDEDYNQSDSDGSYDADGGNDDSRRDQNGGRGQRRDQNRDDERSGGGENAEQRAGEGDSSAQNDASSSDSSSNDASSNGSGEGGDDEQRPRRATRRRRPRRAAEDGEGNKAEGGDDPAQAPQPTPASAAE